MSTSDSCPGKKVRKIVDMSVPWEYTVKTKERQKKKKSLTGNKEAVLNMVNAVPVITDAYGTVPKSQK